MSRVQRSEKILNALEAKGAISHDGKEWFMAASDPFHDTPLRPQGWPDVETANSVVRCVKQSFTVTKPDTLPSGNWDAFIIQWPWLNKSVSQVVGRAASGNTVLHGTEPPAQAIGGLQMYAAPAGSDLNVYSSTSIGNIVGDPYTSGISRVIGLGFEVENTTADIYKQGLCTTWRQNAARRAPSTWTFNVDTDPVSSEFITTPVSIQIYDTPPVNIASAMLIPGSRQWAAEKGSYSVVGFVGQDNPPEYPNYIQWGLSGEDEVPGSTSTSPLVISAAIDDTDGVQSWGLHKLYPLHMSGSYFSGLSEQSSLVVTQVMFIENFPTPRNPEILVLATPSAQYDPIALELYSHSFRHLPVAVPVGENPLGEWFAKVVADAADFVAPIAAAIGGAPLSGLVAGAGALARAYRTEAKAERKLIESNNATLPKGPPPPLPPRSAQMSGRVSNVSTGTRKRRRRRPANKGQGK